MSINTPGGNDALPLRPPSGNGGGDDERPGYPPLGQAERLAAVQAGEAAAQTGDPGAALDADLAALEAGAESPSERAARLGEFVETYLQDICPPENLDVAIECCQAHENICRTAFGDPLLELEEMDAADPGLRQQIAETIPVIEENDEAIAARTGEDAVW